MQQTSQAKQWGKADAYGYSASDGSPWLLSSIFIAVAGSPPSQPRLLAWQSKKYLQNETSRAKTCGRQSLPLSRGFHSHLARKLARTYCSENVFSSPVNMNHEPSTSPVVENVQQLPQSP
jgi:hypothetical protein